MKKWMAVALFLCMMVMLFCGCDDIGQPSHRNCKIATVADSFVSFNPKCPDCGHLNQYASFQISKGESSSGTAVCEKCGKAYEVSVSR